MLQAILAQWVVSPVGFIRRRAKVRILENGRPWLHYFRRDSLECEVSLLPEPAIKFQGSLPVAGRADL
jgi:hypothetical protein